MKITPKKVFQFIEGNTKQLGERFGLLSQHESEQVIYRASICTDCMEKGTCKYCGCVVPGKLYVKESCNKGERFPDIMSSLEWEKFKIKNKIVIKKD